MIVPTTIGGVLMEGLYTVLLRRFERDAQASLATALRITAPTAAVVTAAYASALLAARPARLDVWLAFVPILFTTALGGVYAAYLLAERRYALSILRVPLATGLGVIAVALVVPFSHSIAAFALAMSSGHLTAMTFLALRARGRRPGSDGQVSPAAARTLLLSAFPIFLATLVGGQLVIVIERFFASGVGAGAVSVIAYARGLALIPVQIAQSLGNAILPAAAERERSLGRDAVMRLNVLGLRLGLVAALVSTAYIVICRRELVHVVLQRGELSAGEGRRTAALTALLALSLAGLSAGTIGGKALYAVGRQRIVAWATSAGVLVYVALAFPARALWEVKGLALAFTVSSTATGAALAAALAASSGVGLSTAFRDWLLAPLLQAAAFAAGAYAAFTVLAVDGEGTSRAVEVLAASFLAGLATVLALVTLLRNTEYRLLRLVLGRARVTGVLDRARAGRAA